jgi:hypothetical protein
VVAPREASRRNSFFILIALPAAVGVVAACLALLGSSNPDPTFDPANLARSSGRRFPLTISPDPVMLGTLNAGQHTQFELVLANSGTEPVTVARVATSCPCLSVQQVPIRIGPTETRTLVLYFDPSDEPDFRGGLSIEVVGHDENDSTVFTTRVIVEVR